MSDADGSIHSSRPEMSCEWYSDLVLDELPSVFDERIEQQYVQDIEKNQSSVELCNALCDDLCDELYDQLYDKLCDDVQQPDYEVTHVIATFDAYDMTDSHVPVVVPDSIVTIPARKRKNGTSNPKSYLDKYWNENLLLNPDGKIYPSKSDIQELSAKERISYQKIEQWFINKRRPSRGGRTHIRRPRNNANDRHIIDWILTNPKVVPCKATITDWANKTGRTVVQIQQFIRNQKKRNRRSRLNVMIGDMV